MISINDDAIFLSDAHENSNKTHFLEFLKALENSKIPLPSQIFLLGDMFDYLGSTSHSQSFFKEHLALLNELSQRTQIIYFEGNHDFNLREIFPKIYIIPISSQPAKFDFKGLSVEIAHGDIFLPKITMIALKTLRIRWILRILDFIDRILDNKISKAILRSQMYKKLDYKIENFEEKIATRLENFSADVVIEGHWHQNRSFKINNKFYINLASFACEQSFFMLEYADTKIQILKRSLNV